MTTTTHPTINGMLVHKGRGGVESFYFPDTLGNLTTVRSATGVKTYGAEYWPYGEIQTETGTNPSPWSFVGLLGYLRDTASRLYVRARHYRPGPARWQTVDPLWPSESAYGYVTNRPVDRLDPAGLSSCYWDLILKGVSPYGACVRCSGLPAGEAMKKCAGLPTKRGSAGARDFIRGLFELCPPNNPHTQAGECCVGIATEQGRLIGLVGLGGDIPTAAACDCAARCEAAMKSSPPTEADILAGFKACVGQNANDPGFLGWVKGILEGAHSIL